MADQIRKITEADIARINELYHKSQTTEGLTEEERKEQQDLRKAYVEAIRRNMRGSLNSIDLVNKDGTITNLGEKHDRK